MRNRHNFAIHFNDIDVEFFLMFKRGCKPAFVTFAVVNALLAVT